MYQLKLNKYVSKLKQIGGDCDPLPNLEDIEPISQETYGIIPPPRRYTLLSYEEDGTITSGNRQGWCMDLLQLDEWIKSGHYTHLITRRKITAAQQWDIQDKVRLYKIARLTQIKAVISAAAIARRKADADPSNAELERFALDAEAEAAKVEPAIPAPASAPAQPEPVPQQIIQVPIAGIPIIPPAPVVDPAIIQLGQQARAARIAADAQDDGGYSEAQKKRATNWLIELVASGDIEKVRTFLNNIGNINKISLWAFNFCLAVATTPEIIKELIIRGFNVNRMNSRQDDMNPLYTPLMIIATHLYFNEQLQYELITLLIQAGADVNFRNEKGQTALAIVCNEFYLKYSLIDLLLYNNTNPNYIDYHNERKTPLMLLCSNMHPIPDANRVTVRHLIQSFRPIEDFMSEGDINSKTIHIHKTALNLATEKHHDNIIVLLREFGAIMTDQDEIDRNIENQPRNVRQWE
jgi:hypothetical protein